MSRHKSKMQERVINFLFYVQHLSRQNGVNKFTNNNDKEILIQLQLIHWFSKWLKINLYFILFKRCIEENNFIVNVNLMLIS